jgi:hypothetical protein
MAPTLAAFLDALNAGAEGAAAAEVAFRREAALRVAALERERAHAFRRLNLMRAVASAVAAAEDEAAAVASALGVLREKLDWSDDSEPRQAVLSRFAPVAGALFAAAAPEEPAPPAEVERALAAFEAWYAETRGASFWALFEAYLRETPVVDF